MTQQVITFVEISIFVAFFAALYYRIIKQSARLNRCQMVGGLCGGFGLPIAFFVLIIVAGSGFGGPLFWPLFAVLGAMFGAVIGTLYFLCLGKKNDT